MNLNTQVTLQPVKEEHEEFLLHLYRSTRREELAMLPWSETDKAAFIRMQFDAQRTDYWRRFPDSEHSIVLVDGKEAGRIWINRGSTEIRLLDIALRPEFQGDGVGTRLLMDLQQEARSSGLPLRHSVHKTNLGAIRFYERMGFTPVENYQTHELMEWDGEIRDVAKMNDLREVLD